MSEENKENLLIHIAFEKSTSSRLRSILTPESRVRPIGKVNSWDTQMAKNNPDIEVTTELS